MRRLLLLPAVLCAVLAPAASAGAILRLPVDPQPVRGNPAERLVDVPIEDSEYDPARRCVRMRRPGVERFVAWLQANHPGQYWGAYRCELWGEGRASLHAEGRAVDWHLMLNDADVRHAMLV